MRLLVAGADRVDAGKTTFSTGLLERIDGVGFKPRAGNDYWFDHDDYERAVADGRLYGKDAKRLAVASATAVAPEDVNPVHRLWRPAPGGGTGLVGRADRAFVCDRVGDEYVVNAAADVPASAREALPLESATRVDSVAELNAVTRDRHLPAFRALAEDVAACERAVVESYADVAMPLTDLAVDAVAVVEPGRVRVYDGARWGEACETADEGSDGDPSTGALERTTASVVGALDPVASVGLPALAGTTRADPGAVADAYEVAYDALLAAAVE
jgi:predicted P-loop ATPase/GTPase